MTHSREKKGLCYATAKILQRGRKKQSRCRMRGRKNCRQKKFRNHRYIKNTQRRKIALKQLTQTRNNEDICEYGSYANMIRIIIVRLQARKKMQHAKRTEVRLAKRLGFIQRLRFSNLGLNYRDTSTARDRAQLNTFRLGCRVSIPLGSWAWEMTCDMMTQLVKTCGGPESKSSGLRAETITQSATEQDRINVWSKHRSGVSEGSKGN